MLKRYFLICLMSTLPAMTSMAAEESKPAAAASAPAANVKPEASALKADAVDTPNAALARKRARWSKPGLDLTHCLERETNAEIIRCAE